MKPATQEFLNLVRDAEAPSASDEARIMRSLRTSIAAGAVSTVAVKSCVLPALAAQESGTSTGFLKLCLQYGLTESIASKLSVIALGVAAGLGAADAPLSDSPALAAHSEARAAVAPMRPFDERSSAAESLHEPAAPQPPKLDAVRAASSVAPPPSRPKGKRPERASAPASSVQERPATLRAELELLASVQSDLRRGDGQSALRRLDAHRTSDRQFLDERQAARILALCATGRVAQARLIASEFLKSHPHSVQQEVIANSCAAERLAPK